MFNEDKDVYYDLYQATKITIEELKQFPELDGMTEAELEVLADQLFDLAIAVQKIISES